MPDHGRLPGPVDSGLPAAASRAGADDGDRWTTREGAPSPLGVCYLTAANAYNFALYSKHATGVRVLLYAADDWAHPIVDHRFDPLRNKSGRVWHCRLPAAVVDRATYYAYRVEGPYDLNGGHRFDADKILLDPYARQVWFPPQHSRHAAAAAGPNDGQAPLGVIHACRCEFDWAGDRRPRHSHDTVIYELHVRGFTRRANAGVNHPGTFAGVVEKIPYLNELGITVVELLPVQQRDPAERNYWGYMTLGFFAPESAYASCAADAVSEFRAMVKALHENGIEVVIDVAYNHTTEADEKGPTYSYRGIDNSTYYLLEPDRRWYRNFSGCGNVLHTTNAATRKLILDSMRYWIEDMHVDGFRFDLASVFSRDEEGGLSIEEPPIIAEISAEPNFATARLIAEAWDVAAYQLGRRFPGMTWLQWNSRYRDDVRAFVRADEGTVDGLMSRLYGSDDLFPDAMGDSYHAYQSVNYVTSHDGFNLYDLVSYDHKRNEVNGHANADGAEENRSWNCGWEGDDGVPAGVTALRRRQAKNFCALLMLSNGTPMFCAGDEFLHTQCGNNNPYNQDNETTWLDWDKLAEHAEVFRFFKLMIAFRKRHPSIARSRFWRGDVQWYGAAAAVDRAHWSHTIAYCLRGASEGDGDIYVMANAWNRDVDFRVQATTRGGWCVAVDTGRCSPEDIAAPGQETRVERPTYRVQAHSVVVLTGTPGPFTVGA